MAWIKSLWLWSHIHFSENKHSSPKTHFQIGIYFEINVNRTVLLKLLRTQALPKDVFYIPVARTALLPASLLHILHLSSSEDYTQCRLNMPRKEKVRKPMQETGKPTLPEWRTILDSINSTATDKTDWLPKWGHQFQRKGKKPLESLPIWSGEIPPRI